MSVQTNTPVNIFSKNIPAIRTNLPTCGLLTVCDAVIPTPTDLNTIFTDGSGGYRIMEALFMHQLELNSCNIVQSNLFNFIMANKVDMKRKMNVEIVNSGLSRIRPYIFAERKSPINNNYWNVASGQACDADGTPNGSGAYWRVAVTSPTNIPLANTWFNQPERVFIRSITGGGTATNTAWLVVSSTLENNGQDILLVLQSQNANSFGSAASVTNPTVGLLERGTANVSDFESFCSRPPGLITSNLDEFWIETTRDATCEDELYMQWRDLVFANNPLYAKFYDLPTIEYNKQSGEDFQRRLVNTFFFNKALPNQAIATVDQLQNIETVPLIGESGARCVGKRANAIGVWEQHLQLNRVVDLQGGTLNLPALFQQLYVMQRVRQDSGANPAVCDVFECMIPSQYFPAFNQSMIRYYKDQSAGLLQMWEDVSKGGVKTAPLGFKYRDYPLMWPNITLRIITDKYFDDLLAACANADSSMANVGRSFWIMDWSRIYMGLFASERVVNKTGDLKALAAIDPAYACVMRVPTKTTVLTSMMWTCICEAPQGNLILFNMNKDTPEPTLLAGSYPVTTTSTTTTSTTTSTATTTSTTLPTTSTLPSP